MGREEGADKELEKFVDNIIENLPVSISDFFGVEISKIRVSKSKKSKLIEELKENLDATKQLAKIKYPFANRADWVAGLDILDKAMKGWFQPSQRKFHVADLIRQSYYSIIDAPLNVPYFKQLDYGRICDEIDQISITLFESQRQNLADKLFYEFGQTSDVRILTQALYIHIPKITRYLSQSRKRFKKTDVSKLTGFYGDLSGNYEKSIRIVRGLLQCVEGTEPSYQVLSKDSFANNFNVVKKLHPNLCDGFDSTMRNAIAHRSFFTHFSSETIDFLDHEKSVTMGFGGLFKKCRLLSVVSTATMLSYSIFQARRWENIWSLYQSEKKNPSEQNPVSLSSEKI
ncbi:MAG: hypothetical protein ACYCQJ_10835 [Nitrososphaerales archaeon]